MSRLDRTPIVILLIGLVTGVVWPLSAQSPRVQMQVTHEKHITCLAISPDDHYFATGGTYGKIHVYEFETGRLIHRLIGSNRPSSIKFTPDNKCLIIGDSHGRLSKWEIGRDTLSWQLVPEKNRKEITSIDISQDGKWVAAGTTSRDKSRLASIYIVATKNGYLEKQFMLEKHEINNVWFNDENASLLHCHQKYVTSTPYKKKRQTKKNVILSTLDIYEKSQHALIRRDTFNDFRSNFAISEHTGIWYQPLTANTSIIRVIDTNSGTAKDSLLLPEGSRARGSVAAISSNGKYFATRQGTVYTGKVRIYNLQTRQVQASIIIPKKRVRHMAFSHNNQFLVICQEYAEISIWNITTGKLYKHIAIKNTKSANYAIHPNSKEVALAAGRAFARWDLNSGNIYAAPYNYYNIVSSSSEDASGPRIIPGINSHTNVTALTYSKDGKKLATVGLSDSIHIWPISSDGIKDIWSAPLYLGQHRSVDNLYFSPDSKYLASVQWGVQIWDVESGALLKNYYSSKNPVYTMAMHPTENIIAMTKRLHIGDNKRNYVILFMDLENQNVFDTLHIDPSKYVSRMIYHQNGDYLALFMGKEVQIWSTLTKNKIGAVQSSTGNSPLAFIEEKNLLLYGCKQNAVCKWDWERNESSILFQKNNFVLRDFQISPNKEFMVINDTDGSVSIMGFDDLKTDITLYPFQDWKNWLYAHPEGYYWFNNPRISNGRIHFIAEDQTFGIEQFDLRFHRPDLVLQQLPSADSNIIAPMKRAYKKRLRKMNFIESMLTDDYHIPTCEISNKEEIPINSERQQIELTISASDSLELLDRLNVYVNNVPVYGIHGINLRSEHTLQYDTTIQLVLSKGQNKIQTSVLNQGGAESLKATIYTTYDASERKPNLYLLTIGVSDYQAKGKDLQYAAKDALDIADHYQNNTAFDQTYTKTLTNGQVTRANILDLKKWLESTTVDDQVLIYVSGHGLLDQNYDFYYATHDTDFANPSKKGILYDDIEGLLDGIPARKKLLLMDACHSGEYDKDATLLTQAQQDSLTAKGIRFRGFTKGDGEGTPVLGLQNSFEMMQQLFADLRRGSGATVISSSSGVQVSYEKDEWQNGAFTYAFLYGLKSMKADANQDGQITASEIQAYVAETVPRLTQGLQVPTFRRENLEFDFRVW